MTKPQLIKKLAEAGLEGEVSRTSGGLEVEVANDAAMKKFRRLVAKWGGYKTGYGSWVVQERSLDLGDWNDRTSRHHY